LAKTGGNGLITEKSVLNHEIGHNFTGAHNICLDVPYVMNFNANYYGPAWSEIFQDNCTRDNVTRINDLINNPNNSDLACGHSQEYIYVNADASGTKTIDYYDEVEYKDGEIQAIYLSDGRLTKDKGGDWIMEYYIKDHLGNNRIVFRDTDGNGKISLIDSDREFLQETHHYPFGMSYEDSEKSPWHKYSNPDNKNNYLYNGKEFQSGIFRSEGGVDIDMGLLDFGFRYYDPSIGRFTGVDPISDQFAWVSTYNYAENKPVNGIDLWGLQFVNANDAKIIMHVGGASLKRSNISNPTNYRIYTGSIISGIAPDGTPTMSNSFSDRVGNLNFSSGKNIENRKATKGSVHKVEKRTSGDSKQNTRWRKSLLRNGLAPGHKEISIPNGKGKSTNIAWVVSQAANFITNMVVNQDLRIADDQYNEYGRRAENLVYNAIGSNLIPLEFRTDQKLADIGNYIFQGEFRNSYDEDTFNRMKQVSQNIIQRAGINCHTCPQD